MRRVINNFKNHQNWLAYYSDKYTGKKTSDFEFHLRNGMKIQVPRRLMQTYKELFFDETYTKGFPMQFNKESQMTIVDVGANVGYFSLFMLAMFPKSKVFSFEPMPMNFKQLQKYQRKNSDLDLTVVNQAVSKEVGTITLNYDANDSFSTAASIHQTHDQKDTISVKTTTLEKVLTTYSVDKIDFLKLDCEGSEYDILYNCPKAILNQIQYISIETHEGESANENQKSLEQFLKQNGFQLNSYRSIIWAWK